MVQEQKRVKFLDLKTVCFQLWSFIYIFMIQKQTKIQNFNIIKSPNLNLSFSLMTFKAGLKLNPLKSSEISDKIEKIGSKWDKMVQEQNKSEIFELFVFKCWVLFKSWWFINSLKFKISIKLSHQISSLWTFKVVSKLYPYKGSAIF